MSPRVLHDPTDFEDDSDALAELRFEFETSKVGMALAALYAAVQASSDARDRVVTLNSLKRAYVAPLSIEERAAERLLNALPELADFTEKLVSDQFEIELTEQRRLTA